MSTLLQLQEQFQDYLLNENPAIEKNINSTMKVSTSTRLAVYGGAYTARLIEALSSSYPAIHKLLGDEEFNELAIEYIKEYPSTYRSIRWFGDKFDIFLNGYDCDEYLIELATLEWTMTLVFDAKDSHVVKIDEIASVSPELWSEMRLIPHDSIHLLNFSWNTIQIWQALINDNNPPEDVKSEKTQACLFWRHEQTCNYCSIDNIEAYAITALKNKASFGEICEGLCEFMSENDAPMAAASFLKKWVTSGMIAGLEI